MPMLKHYVQRLYSNELLHPISSQMFLYWNIAYCIAIATREFMKSPFAGR
jgi:hypothetical protein